MNILGIAWENIFIGLLGAMIVTGFTYCIEFFKSKLMFIVKNSFAYKYKINILSV